uniref:RNA-directed RNA polymerase n=1 Tax=Panagrolaimus sp. JU765 TaxID=591449 RepID=A0AC34R5S7_9BILA
MRDVRIRFRIVFRGLNDEGVNTFKNYALKQHYARFRELVFGKHIIYEQQQDPRIESDFQVTVTGPSIEQGRNELHNCVVYAIREVDLAFDGIRRNFMEDGRFPENVSFSILLVSKDIFPKTFELRTLVPVNGFYLGNVVSRTEFLNSAFVFLPPDEKSTALMCDFMYHGRDEEGVLCSMLLMFEHDRDCFDIIFPDCYTQHQGGMPKRMERIVEITTKYKTIRRMILTIGADKEDGTFAVTMTFQLMSPMEIFVYKIDDNQQGAGRFRSFGQRFLTWNKKADYERLMANSSCVKLKGFFKKAKELLVLIDRLQRATGLNVEFRILTDGSIIPLTNYVKTNLEEICPEMTDFKFFKLAYAIEALVSRGGLIYDYFFHPNFRQFDEFVLYVKNLYIKDLEQIQNQHLDVPRTVAVLEEMLNMVDRQTDISPPLMMFRELYDNRDLKFISNLTKELLEEGYMRVRRVIVTPTRRLYVNPELVMGNRSLRKVESNHMLRVVFRDEGGRMLSSLPTAIINDTVHKLLSKPLKVGCQLFSYVGSSNSQLRDHGCYFILGTDEDACRFRMMSRMGQVFTQSKELTVALDWPEYSDVFDYIGGLDSNGKPYTFSDGCGQVSEEFCKKIVKDLKLGDCRPSCFQIRFRGYKGVLCVNTDIDNTYSWMKERNKLVVTPRGKKLPWYQQSIHFRPSQRKFIGPLETRMEIVKFSTPINVNLNKPLINILDQVSEMQGPVVHHRVKNRICVLLEEHVQRSIDGLVDEMVARSILSEFTRYFHYNRLQEFYITEEPFLRSLLRATCSVSLLKLVDKMRIRIPRSDGRMMFGVVDETGLLQYGEVFIQYTVNCDLKYPNDAAEKKILRGKVMVTKNPSVVAGDVRLFEAVDLPALRDLVDVIVFPQQGPRPHPDEMAGSDLDGDEYSIFWDPQLFLNENEPAFDFTSPPPKTLPPTDIDPTQLTKYMVEFFTKYISQDSIGHIANAHLANSDLYGLNSDVCLSIAKKHNQAVDFPKTGQIPDELTKKWGPKGEPPERIERFPNFMARSNSSCYKSCRLLGELHSRVSELCEMVGFESLMSIGDEIQVDDGLLINGYEQYLAVAEREYNEYKSMIDSLLDSYGINGEGELFSGQFTALKKRISERDNDDMSLFNTSHMIEEQVGSIVAKFRNNFFDEFGGLILCTEVENGLEFYGLHETFRRVCNYPTEQMRQKASAYYCHAYTQKTCLSFAWLVAEILATIRRDYLQINKNFSYHPLDDQITERIDRCCEQKEFADFREELLEIAKTKISSDRISHRIAELVPRFTGLDKLLFYNRKWAELHQVSVGEKELDYILYMLGCGFLNKGGGAWLQFDDPEDETIIDLRQHAGGLGRRFIQFIKYLMSYEFGSHKSFTFGEISPKIWTDFECQELHIAATQTFYPIAVNRRFDVIPGNIDSTTTYVEKYIEGSHFVIEVPKRFDIGDSKDNKYDDMLKKIAIKCGCKRIVRLHKPEKHNPNIRIIVAKPVGTFRSIQTLRRLLTVEPVMEKNLKSRADGISEQIRRKLEYYSKDTVSITDPWPPKN